MESPGLGAVSSMKAPLVLMSRVVVSQKVEPDPLRR
jgi:hypothetical protein